MKHAAFILLVEGRENLLLKTITQWEYDPGFSYYLVYSSQEARPLPWELSHVLTIKFGVTRFYRIPVEGVGRAINFALRAGFEELGHDTVTTLADDIVEPEDSLALRAALCERLPGLGACSIPPAGERMLDPVVREGFDVSFQQLVGNMTYTRAGFDQVGLMDESYGFYGPFDLDWCDRSQVAGLTTAYIVGTAGFVQTSDKDREPDYYSRKQAALDVSWRTYVQKRKKYYRGELKPLIK